MYDLRAARCGGVNEPVSPRRTSREIGFIEQRWVGEAPATLDLACIGPDPRFHLLSPVVLKLHQTHREVRQVFVCALHFSDILVSNHNSGCVHWLCAALAR
jgi:hypothetical protein